MSDNDKYRGIDWEIEDLLSETLMEAFLADNPSSLRRPTCVDDRIHRDWTEDGKA